MKWWHAIAILVFLAGLVWFLTWLVPYCERAPIREIEEHREQLEAEREAIEARIEAKESGNSD